MKPKAPSEISGGIQVKVVSLRSIEFAKVIDLPVSELLLIK